MLSLREHQTESVAEVDKQFSLNVKNVCLVLPTGAGKTIVKAYYAWRCAQSGRGCVVFAHRDVLLEQISGSLCKFGVYHSIWASRDTVKYITNANLAEYGNSFYRETSTIVLASVDTFWRRDVKSIIPYISLWMMDEGHHLTKGSKWHRCVAQLDDVPTVKGLIVTATPLRADKKGLGRHASGLVDALVVGTDMGTLIARGMLSKYKIFVPDSLVDTTDVNATSSGDFNRDKLAAATDKSHITGNVVQHWLSIAGGKRTIIFTVNIAHSNHVAQEFRSRGVKAVALSSEDKAEYRSSIIAQFRRGEIDILVNCDLFSEGFDVPAVEVVVMLRKTLSYALFKQQFGRMLRVIDGKEYGVLIDHVGNVPHFMEEYGLEYPHDDPDWTLNNAPKRKASSKNTLLKAITCRQCRAYYVPTSQTKDICPECKRKHSDNDLLDDAKAFQERRGQLVEMDLSSMNKLLEERKKVDEDSDVLKSRMQCAGMPTIVVNSAVKKHKERKDAQVELRSQIQQWCKITAFNTCYPPDLIQREFELAFGMPIIKAQTLSSTDAANLTKRLIDYEWE